MTGIERLRGVAGFWRENKLDDIVEQIEREQGGRVSRMRVLSVVTEMERHVSGAEGMEDSPVARWARELREALGGDGRDPAADVSMSAYDLLPQEDRDAIAWVREHGGLDAVKRRWECLSYYADPVPRSCMEKRLARLQRQIDESHAALRRRREIISELNHRASDLTRENAELRKRAMPEGYEWPRFESGEPVMLGDSVVKYVGGGEFEVRSIEFRDGAAYLREGFRTEGIVIVRPGERVKRPSPKVLDADGVEIRVGDTVYLLPGDWCDEFPCLGYHGGEELEVFSLHADHVVGGIGCRDTRRPKGTCYPQPSQLTHRAPILAADGKPLREGETVWNVKTGERYVVGAFASGCVNVSDGRGGGLQLLPSQLTHERPESWERLEDDATMPAATYCERMGIEVEEGHSFVEPMARDLVRRCKAFAERDR